MSKISVVRKEGGSRVLSVTKIIPAAWTIVELELVKIEKKRIMVKIERVK